MQNIQGFLETTKVQAVKNHGSIQECNRIILKPTLKDLPKIRDRYPFLYLQHGRLQIDDSSVKWISAQNQVFSIPSATIQTIMLGPGTTITHDAVKSLSQVNTTICWVGQDSLLFYAIGQTPTSKTRNLMKQVKMATDQEKTLAVAKRMFLKRFPETSLRNKKLKDLMVMQGNRVKQAYKMLSEKYNVYWDGRRCQQERFLVSDTTNMIITYLNQFLYALVSSMIYSLGLTAKIGFVHSGSPLPFTYDISDLYKHDLVFDTAFSLTKQMNYEFDKRAMLEQFRKRVISYDLLKKCPQDISNILELKDDGDNC